MATPRNPDPQQKGPDDRVEMGKYDEEGARNRSSEDHAAPGVFVSVRRLLPNHG